MTALSNLSGALPLDNSYSGPVAVMAGDLRAVLPNRKTKLVTVAVLAGLFALGRWSAR